MTGYRDVASALPRPTEGQVHAFAEHVGGDRSWYKKLPLGGAGEPFLLFLDPDVHRVAVTDRDGRPARRDVVEARGSAGWLPQWELALEDGDEASEPLMLNYHARGMSTAERVRRMGHWRYWNWGPPEQSRIEAVEQANRALRVAGPDGPVELGEQVLELGLVYLRATVSGHLPADREREHEALRGAKGVPSVADDRAAQLAELVAAMRRVVAWIDAE